VAALNAAYRNRSGATNVLSFPMLDPAEIAEVMQSGATEVLLGDIVLAHGVCASEASERSVPMKAHAAHLIVHGALHLLGYGHHTEEVAAEMEAAERAALARLGIP